MDGIILLIMALIFTPIIAGGLALFILIYKWLVGNDHQK